MNTKTRILAVILTAVLLVCSIPTGIFASTYTVTLYPGPEGQGSAVTLTKMAGQPLSLAHLRADVTARYGLEPKGGSSDQRVFIKWSTSYDTKTSQGTGESYFESYTEDADVTLYAIWGYPIMFNADGGRFADGSTKKLTYVANYAEWLGENTDPKSMYRYTMPDWNGDVPVKAGAKRVGNSSGYAYGLIREDGTTFFTWEGHGENLTIPPAGGGYYPSGNYNSATWAMFRCVEADDPDNPYGIAFPEFVAIWEPSVTYDPNGGNGKSYSEYLEWGWSKLWKYESYKIDSNSFSHPSGAKFLGWNTKPDGSGRAYAAGRSVTNFGSNSNPVTLYAQWESIHTHSYQESITTQPNCANTGLKTFTCSCGDNYSETIPATGEHSYDAATTDATCVAEGKTVYTCSVCSDSYSEVIPATGIHNYESVITNPTCGMPGANVYTCTVCGDNYSETIPATGSHSYESVTTEPTCTLDGKTVYTCTVCSDSYSEAIPSLGGHNYETVVTEPTCGADGVKTFTCTVCNDIITEVIEKTGEHTYDNILDTECNGCSYVREKQISGKTLVKLDGVWKYIVDGEICKDNTLVKYNGKWYHVNGGKWVKDTTLVKYNGVWFYVKNGVKNNSNTLVKYNNKWYHVNGGKWVKDTTLVKYNNVWYYIKNGVKNSSNTLVKYNNKWYHVNGGKWVKDTTLVKYNSKWYYVNGGKVDFSYSGNVSYNGKTYFVKKGIKV